MNSLFFTDTKIVVYDAAGRPLAPAALESAPTRLSRQALQNLRDRRLHLLNGRLHCSLSILQLLNGPLQDLNVPLHCSLSTLQLLNGPLQDLNGSLHPSLGTLERIHAMLDA